MLTDLYGARVLALAPDERRVRFRIFVIRYDRKRQSHPPLPDDTAFFLRLLWEIARNGDPIHGEVTAGEVRDDAWAARNGQRFVERAERVDGRDLPNYDLLNGDFHYEREGR